MVESTGAPGPVRRLAQSSGYGLGIEILQVVTSTDRRGAEVFAVDLGDALTALGHRVRTVALAPGSTAPALGIPTLGPSPLALSTLRGLRRGARTADVVVAHGSRTLPACALALVGSTPFVYRNIGDPTQWSGSGLRHARTKVFLTRAAAVVALTDRAAATLRDDYGIAARELTVIPTGAPSGRHRPADAGARAEARRSLGIPTEGPVAAIIGALSKEKRADLTVEAIAQLPDVHLIVAGAGPERAHVEKLADLRAPGRVHFTGALADPSPAFDATDVVVLSSRTEGLPGVLVEAGLRGLPAITTDVGYVRDVVVDGETGVIVDSSNPRDLASAIRRAISQAARLGAAAHARCIAEFEMGSIAKRWSTLLGTLHGETTAT